MTEAFPYIKDYNIQKIIGQGGMGKVYLAIHTSIGRKVAIKILSPVYATNPDIRERFKNEAILLAALRHPNIVALYDYKEEIAGLCLIMEYVEGITLDSYITSISGPIPEEKSNEIFLKILDAFEYAHHQNIIHRDIKPSNVMLTEKNEVKILDFGIAKVTDKQNRKLTQTGMRLGTLYYMSPEQIRSRETDNRSDIYSLGVLLFEMLTGKGPYENFSEYDINLAIVNDPLPRAKSFYPNISDHIQAIIDKATAKNPLNRFQTVDEFKKALQDPTQKVVSGNSLFGEEEDKLVMEWTFQTIKEKRAKENQQTQNSQQRKVEEVEKEEKSLFENFFGTITNQKITFYRGKDLFEKGQVEEIKLDKIASVQLKKNREYFTGFFLSFITFICLFTIPGIYRFIVSVPLIPFCVICFRIYPTIVIVRKDDKRFSMKNWPWKFEQAKKFTGVLKKVITYYEEE